MLDGIEPYDLITAVIERLLLARARRGIVAGRLRRTCAAGRGSGVSLSQPDSDGLDAGAEDPAGRGGDDDEEVGVGWLAHAKRRSRRDHHWPQVQALLGIRWHPVSVGCHQQLKGLDE